MFSGPQNGGGNEILSIPAGIAKYENFTVSSQEGKGRLRVFKDFQGIIHLQWISNITNSAEIDLIVFPGDMSSKAIVREDGVVLRLKLVNGRMLFFWVQEKVENPEELAEKLEKALNSEN